MIQIQIRMAETDRLDQPLTIQSVTILKGPPTMLESIAASFLQVFINKGLEMIHKSDAEALQRMIQEEETKK